MTAMSPLGRVPNTRQTRRQRGRRAWPFLTFLLVLVVVAGVVWWRVFNEPATTYAAKNCAHATTATSLKPANVSVRVYNATDREGLAGRVGRQLQDRKINVVSIANDPTNRKVTGVGEIRYGDAGTAQAHVIKAMIPGATLVKDSRTDAVVDLALGPKFAKVAPSHAVEQALQHTPTSASSSPGC